MRILPLVLGLSLVGCITGEIGSTGPGGDDVGGDDDGSGSGSGSGSNTPEPRVMVTTDNPTVNTELGTTQMITVNVDAANFTGPVNLTASVINPTTMAPVPGWNVSLATATVDVTADGITPVVATLTIPSQNAGELTGEVKIDATSSLGTTSTSSTVTALNQVSIQVAENNGQCVYPTGAAASVTVKLGTKVRFVNKFTTDPIVIHSDNTNVIGHQGQGSAPADQGDNIPVNQAYEVTTGSAKSAGGNLTTGTARWYCHAPGPNAGQQSVVVVP